MFSLVGILNISICTRFIPGRMNVIANDLSRAGQIRGVVIASGHRQPHLPKVGSTQLRPFCHVVQHQVSNLRVSNIGQQSPQHRCFSNEMGRDFHIRIPSPADSHTSPPRVQPDEVLHHHPSRPVLVKTGVVPEPSKPSSGTTKSVTSWGENAVTTQVQRLPPESLHAKSACMLSNLTLRTEDSPWRHHKGFTLVNGKSSKTGVFQKM